jgi:regulator of sigma E protease
MLLTAIIFLVILSILVFVHELGHYSVARLVGVHVEEFGFGLPPRIAGKKIGRTIYSINWLPIGGFVKLAGEDADDTEIKKTKSQDKRHVREYFWAKSKKARAAILVAGVFMNFLLAVLLTTILLVSGAIEQTDRVHVEKVNAGSPAQSAGLQADDVITAVAVVDNGEVKKTDVHDTETMINLVKAHAGQSVTLYVMRGGSPLTVSLVPRVSPPAGEGALGVTILDLEEKKYPLPQAIEKSVVICLTKMWQMLGAIGNLLWRLVTGGTIQSGEVAGPVGIAQVTGEARKYGWKALLEFMSILSLNLALLNILPLPALDGGRLAFVVFEKMGRKARPELERTIHQFGMIFLLLLLLLITINDVLRMFRG